MYGRIQDDEILALWALARQAGPGPLAGLFGGAHMARVQLAFDADEVRWGEAGDAASAGHPLGDVELDVDVESQFIWFDKGELDELPGDLADPEPTRQELERVHAIAADFGEGYLADARTRQPGRLTELFTDRMLRDHPTAYRAAAQLVRAITPM
jgi:hypothetical protein